MSLRLRLIVAFFVLSVVPLGAVTIYTYSNNVSAVRDAAAREADLLAGELTQRMQLVTAQLSERVEHLMDLPQAEVTVSAKADEPKPAATAHPSKPASATAANATPAPAASGNADMTGMDNKVAVALGEAAMLLNNVELRGMRPGGAGPRRDNPRPPGDLTVTGRGRGARDTTPGASGRSGTGAGAGSGSAATTLGANAAGTASTTTSTSSNEKPPRLGSTGDLSSVPHFTPPPGQTRFRQGGRGARPDAPDAPATAATAAGTAPTTSGSPTPPGAPPAPGMSVIVPAPGTTPPGVPTVPATIVDISDPTHITIDMAPIWRDVLHQIVPDGKIENLSPDERQRVAREVNQRLLGIKQGLQISAAGLQKQAEDIRKEAETQTPAAETTTAETKAPAPPSTPSPMKKVTALTGNHLNVQMQKNGQVVQQVNAEINLPNVLATVFSTTRRDRGEVPFAIGKDGHIYTPTDDDRAKVESLGLAAPGAPGTSESPSTSIKGDWIVVTTADPSGSGLRFGIARPVGDSMAQLRTAAARNAGFGLLLHRDRARRHRAAVGAAHAQSVDAHRRRRPHRARRLPRARAGEVERRDRQARDGVQPDGGRRRDASARGRRAGAHQARARARAARFSTTCCRTRRCSSG